jgi:hypothetical protein
LKPEMGTLLRQSLNLSEVESRQADTATCE